MMKNCDTLQVKPNEPLGEIELAFRVHHNPKLVEPPLVPDEPEMESEEMLAKGRSQGRRWDGPGVEGGRIGGETDNGITKNPG